MPQVTPPKPTTDAPADDERSRKDLLKEIEYLRAEVAYLKKLDTLVQAKKAAPEVGGAAKEISFLSGNGGAYGT